MIVADTSIWIDYLNGYDTPIEDVVQRLIDDAEIALTGIVLMELLRGTRGEDEQERLEAQLEGATFVEMTVDTWRRAGIISAQLDSKGMRMPPSDVILAAVALEGDHELLTRDRHFERVPGLRLYDWKGHTGE